ncbi:Lsr2 family protein [Dietzia cinnamea]|uniref:histone-like nucleoid-structuring protein Lsr2 n=1 Tax=Dietzia cinnamea TaxID=321318 RepID=UPI00223C37FC|nr:Lsr2 family protein [Dietzia cinnamea]MCT2300199.1 Lsr2 family protein [Dietzia cinnamea]
MAVRYETIYVDDLDGAEIEGGRAETIEFAFDGKTYTIDLDEQNAAAFREAIQPYLSAARPADNGKKRAAKTSRRSSSSTTKSETGKIRAWARENGHTVSDRGRIPADIMEAYRAAN